MASDAKYHDWVQHWLEQFPQEERVCDEINHAATRRRAIDIMFPYIDPQLDRPTHRILTRYRLTARPEDVQDYKQKGWERFILRAHTKGIPWDGPSTLFRAVYSCIKCAARQSVRHEQLGIRVQSSTDVLLAQAPARRVKLIRIPVEDEETSERDVNNFLFKWGSSLDLDALLESKEKARFLMNLLCEALRCVEGKYGRNMCILWFFMQLPPAQIEAVWGANLNQSRLRQAKLSFINHCLRLLAEAKITCVTTFGPDFIANLTAIFEHFRNGDASDKDLNQHHPLVMYLHSLVPANYIHLPRAADAVETFITSLQGSDW